MGKDGREGRAGGAWGGFVVGEIQVGRDGFGAVRDVLRDSLWRESLARLYAPASQPYGGMAMNSGLGGTSDLTWKVSP